MSGLPLAVAFCEAGHTVIGVDVDARKIAALQRGRELHRGRARPSACTRCATACCPPGGYADLSRCDAVIIAVPTPLTRNREPDLGPLIAAVAALAARAPARPARGARVHHLPRHHPRAARPAARGVGARRRAGLQPRLLARAHRPGPHRLHHAHHPEGGRRAHRRVPRARRRASTSEICDEVVRGLHPRGRPSSPSCSRTSSAR